MPLAVWLFGCLLVLQSVRADDTRLIRVGEFWRYFKGTAEPSAELGAWRQPGFDDTAWHVAMGGVSTAGVSTETTLLAGYGAQYRTVYLRKAFRVSDKDSIASLILRVDYDDGFVIYINGLEVARRGVPGVAHEPVPVTESAAHHPRGGTEEIPLAAGLGALRNGVNLLAVQLLGSGTNDLSATWVSELLGNFTRGPFLQSTTAHSTLLVWKTAEPAFGFFDLEEAPGRTVRRALLPGQTNHVAALTNLAPDTLYRYRAGAALGPREVVTDWQTFRTFKREGPVEFIVLGDSGLVSPGQFAVAERMKATRADLILHTGDLIYYGFSHQTADFRCLSVYAEQFRSTPFFPMLGNHEMYADRNAALETFYLPTNSVTGTEHYYSFDHGDVHFAIAWSDLAVGANYQPGSPQFLWLDQDLAKTSKPWKFLFFHHGWRTSSIHQYDDYDFNAQRDVEQIDHGLGLLARKHGVQIIFNGHDHCYERLKPSGGPVSFVSGGGGAVLYPLALAHPDSVQFHLRHHFLKVSVRDLEAVVQGVGTDGEIFDTVHLRRAWPERRVHTSAWGSPTIESAPANDQDGNLLGQRFDFAGDPINGRLGLQTSAGRLFVSNDRRNLYLGLDEVMLGAAEELFLFLEVPGISGTTTLAALGNGVVDPLQEGVDGFDFAANLGFENFRPSVGLILGDEFGDHPFRSFPRPGQPLDSGQGAFYLSQGLPEVPGQRLNQFNRTPQVTPVPYERNADFIEVALPYSSLGGLRPGETIRVGAALALAGLNTHAGWQTRAWDSGGIGLGLRPAGADLLLEGVEVRLAADPDPDDDQLTEAEELALGTNPNQADTDGDNLPDGWEVRHRFNPLSAPGTGEGEGDPDGDGLVNFREWALRANPRSADTDGDALPDRWEADHGLDPASALGQHGAQGDWDLDGAANQHEFRAGTDPRSAASRFSFATASWREGMIELVWHTVPGRSYHLQSRPDFASEFEPVASGEFPKRATGLTDSCRIEFSPDPQARMRYYRIKLIEE